MPGLTPYAAIYAHGKGASSVLCRQRLRIQPHLLTTNSVPAPAPTGSGLTWSRVLQNKVFIVKLLPVDGFASGAIVVGEISSLTHELGDDAVETAPTFQFAGGCSLLTPRLRHRPCPHSTPSCPLS
uniref:Uncharacterized protein n=1 Tax=Gopherus agassizii TaxID=38772 RepID=A0A452GKM8_9SAUR